MEKLRVIIFVSALIGLGLTGAFFSFCRWETPWKLTNSVWCGEIPSFFVKDFSTTEVVEKETAIKNGTYVVYSVEKTKEKDLYWYRLEDGVSSKIKTFNSGTVLYKVGPYFFFKDSDGVSKETDLTGQEITNVSETVRSNNGKFYVISEPLNSDSGELPIARDGLGLKVFDANDNFVAESSFFWKDVGYENMNESWVWFLSDDGDNIYIVGRTNDSMDSDVFWRYSIKTNRWSEVIHLENNSETTSQITWYDNDAEKFTFLKIQQNGQHIAYGVDLPSGETHELWRGELGEFQGAVWSPDGKSVGLLGEDECFSEVKIGQTPSDTESCEVRGALLDWIDNFLILDQVGKLVLFNLETKESIFLTGDGALEQDYYDQIFEYLGTVKKD